MLKDKILAELRKKYPGLSQTVLGLLAEKLEPTTTEESQIEAAVAGLENLPIKPADYAALLQREGDRRVSEAEKKWKKPADDKKEDKEDKKDEDPNNPNAALAKQLQAMMEKLNQIEQKDKQRTVAQKLEAQLKEKKIPLAFAKGLTIDSEDDLETAIQQAESSYQEVKQELTNQGLISGLPKPGGQAGGAAGAEKTAQQVDAEIKAWAEKDKVKSN
jgi:hypothetical protein